MSRFYDDPRYGTPTPLTLGHGLTATSAGGASSTTIAVSEPMANVTVSDFNVRIRSIGTGAGTSGSYTFLVGKSLAGTGAVTAIGTATVAATAITANSVVDGACTSTTCSTGDHLVIQQGAGTCLPVSSIVLDSFEVKVTERFVAD